MLGRLSSISGDFPDAVGRAGQFGEELRELGINPLGDIPKSWQDLVRFDAAQTAGRFARDSRTPGTIPEKPVALMTSSISLRIRFTSLMPDLVNRTWRRSVVVCSGSATDSRPLRPASASRRYPSGSGDVDLGDELMQPLERGNDRSLDRLGGPGFQPRAISRADRLGKALKWLVKRA